MVYKVGVKRFADIVVNGEVQMTNGEYWTTVEANDERQAKILAQKNLLVRIAKNECGNVRCWKNIYLDLSDMVIGG